MNFFARTPLALAMVLSAMIIGAPQAMAQKKDAEKCPAQAGGTATLNVANDPNTSLDVVGTCNVTMLGTYTFDKVRVKSGGTLLFSEEKLTGKVNENAIEFAAKSIVVETGGTLQAGTAGAPIGTRSPANRVVIRMLGDRPAKRVTADDCSVVDKGIAVMAGGTLRLYGAKGVPSRGGVSWTYLSAPAGPSTYEDTSQRIGAVVTNGQNGRRIQLARSVTGGSNPWQPGDWIVIATTSYSPFESEFAQIDQIDPVSGTDITLKTPLKHYHFGGLDPGPAVDASAPFGSGTASASFSAGKERNYGVDERAEVGLISRNIVLTADTADAFAAPTDSNRNWGGETKFCSGFKEVSLEGVEIAKFGKEALGSYPLHFHLDGDVAGTMRVNANSVHHSYNKCVAIHLTTNAVYENNVCARITGHVFYQEIGDEFNSTFTGNLAVGAMNNSFGLENDATSATGYWDGDNMAVGLGFTGLGIANTDGQSNPVHGSCYYPDNVTGLLSGRSDPGCSEGQYYVEPPTGFWIINPTAVLEGNSVAGCQGQGRGYWYVPPKTGNLKFQPVGKFRNNRVHGCYDGIFGEPEDAVSSSEQLFPKVGAVSAGLDLIARFEGFTASRIRNRAVWMRPAWNVFENARIATSREGVALVTAGGLDSDTPGVWGLLKNAVVVGVSTNNVDRWGPCAEKASIGDRQELHGCVDYNTSSRELAGKKYPGPDWNFAGFYIYDGPVRIHDTRFVRFQVDPRLLLTTWDEAVLDRLMPSSRPYEGDAALGWFASNPSAYPTATEVQGLQFEETNLRHQIFTEKVNLSAFLDGDKNTAVIDRDGSLTGFRVLDKDGTPLTDHFPISLNNLPFNSSSNAVDECLAEGAQDTKQEGRATSLISPGSMASLEFGALALPDGHSTNSTGQVPDQSMTFTRDSTGHASMTLTGRNSQGIWEPKVASGLGYTVRASNGIPKIINIGLTDAVKPRMNVDPFYVRVGVCYSDSNNGVPPNPKFQVFRGYKSWGGGNLNYNNAVVRKYFNRLENLYNGQICVNLDAQNRGRNLDVKGCPADGVVVADGLLVNGKCPDGRDPVTAGGESSCIYKSTELTEGTFEQLAPDGKPDATKYYYDKDTGMLFFYVMQNEVNALAPSPVGSCVTGNDSACPKPDESFYGCPAQGCTTYTVEILDSNYAPGPSLCGGNKETDIYAKVPKYVLAEPTAANQLGYVGGNTPVVPQSKEDKPGFPHRVAMTAAVCKGTP